MNGEKMRKGEIELVSPIGIKFAPMASDIQSAQSCRFTACKGLDSRYMTKVWILIHVE